MVKAVLEHIAVAGDGDAFLVLLKTAQDEIVPIVIGQAEAMSIVAGQNKDMLLRPLSHDLMLSIIEMLNAKIQRIEITDLLEGTFYAKLVVENRGIEIDIDARPSDAIAIAVRVDAPLFIAEHVVEEVGREDLLSNSSGTVEA